MKCTWKGLSLVVPLLLAFALPAHASNVTQESTKDVVESITKQVATVSAVNTVTSINARASAVLGLGGGAFTPRGLSGGNNGEGIGLWVMANGYWLDKSGSTAPYTGDLYMLTAGADKRIDDLVVGISVGGEWLDLKLKSDIRDGKYKSKGFTVSPYASYLVRDDVMLDFTVGYSKLSNDISIYDMDNGTNEIYELKDDYSSWRLFGATGVTKMWEHDAWRFSSRLGALYLHQSDEAFNLRGRTTLDPRSAALSIDSSKFDLFQLQLGGRVGYDFGNIMPFVGVTYFQDIAKTGSNKDMAGADFDLGFNWKNGPVTVGITGTYGIREDFQKAGGMLNFRFDF